MILQILEEVIPNTEIIEEIIVLQVSIIEGSESAAVAAAVAAVAAAAAALTTKGQIDDSLQNIVPAISQAGTDQVGLVNTAGSNAVGNINTARTDAIGEITPLVTNAQAAATAATTAKTESEDARDEINNALQNIVPAIGQAGADQVGLVNTAGSNAVGNISTARTDAIGEITPLVTNAQAAATAATTAKNQSEGARDAILAKVNFAGSVAGDLLRDVNGIYVPQRPDLAIVRAFYRIQTALIPRLIQHEGFNITGNGGLTNFTDPISSLSYRILSGLVANTAADITPSIIYVNGFDESSLPTNKGIILGINSTNYIELIWNRNSVCIFRRIENGNVVSSNSSSIGGALRGAPYQLQINLGGFSSRTSIGALITGLVRVSFSFDDNIISYRQNITFIALTANIVGSVNNNICIAGQKFT